MMRLSPTTKCGAECFAFSVFHAPLAPKPSVVCSTPTMLGDMGMYGLFPGRGISLRSTLKLKTLESQLVGMFVRIPFIRGVIKQSQTITNERQKPERKAEYRIQNSGVRRKEKQKTGLSLIPFWILNSDSWILLFYATFNIAGRVLKNAVAIAHRSARVIYLQGLPGPTDKHGLCGFCPFRIIMAEFICRLG